MRLQRRATRPPAGRPLASRRIGSSQRSARRLGRRIEREVGPRRILRRLGESNARMPAQYRQTSRRSGGSRSMRVNTRRLGRSGDDAQLRFVEDGISSTRVTVERTRTDGLARWMVRRCGDGVIAVLGGAAMHIHPSIRRHQPEDGDDGRARGPEGAPRGAPGRPLGPARALRGGSLEDWPHRAAPAGVSATARASTRWPHRRHPSPNETLALQFCAAGFAIAQMRFDPGALRCGQSFVDIPGQELLELLMVRATDANNLRSFDPR